MPFGVYFVTHTHTCHSSSIEPQERHLKDLRFGDDGYGMRGDVLVSTLEDCLNVDVVC